MGVWRTADGDISPDARRVAMEMEEVASCFRYSSVYFADADGAVVALCLSVLRIVRWSLELVFGSVPAHSIPDMAILEKAKALPSRMGALFGVVGALPYGYSFLGSLGYAPSIYNGNVVGKKYE